MQVLNLGCGEETYGTCRVDAYPTKTTTHVFDVEKGLQFPDSFFDVVYEKNLLEHLRNPGFHLEEVFRVLKKGGKLILITDYAGCYRYYFFGTHEGRYEKKHKNNPEDKHYSIFSRQHLQNHLVKVGFLKISVKLIKTDTKGRFLDAFTGDKPRLRAVAIK